MQSIALNPASKVEKIYGLTRGNVDAPALDAAPSSWVLSLKHTAGGFDGPGRMAFDSRGNIWITNNFGPPENTSPGRTVISLDPNGNPRNGGAVRGGGILGNWWGIAVDHRDRVWLSNFTGDDPNEFYSPAFEGGKAASLFTAQGKALSPATGFQNGHLLGPQGIAVDQQDNVWIANHTADTVTEYRRGLPSNSRVISGGGMHNPFAISVDGDGNVWVDNGALDFGYDGTVTKISPDGTTSGPYPLGVHSPQGSAIDFEGNLWVASFSDKQRHPARPRRQRHRPLHGAEHPRRLGRRDRRRRQRLGRRVRRRDGDRALRHGGQLPEGREDRRSDLAVRGGLRQRWPAAHHRGAGRSVRERLGREQLGHARPDHGWRRPRRAGRRGGPGGHAADRPGQPAGQRGLNARASVQARLSIRTRLEAYSALSAK